MNCACCRFLLAALLTVVAASLPAQKTIDLSGKWQLAIGERPDYRDRVVLPGSLTTNGKGDEVTAHTVWTGSTYDSSYYFNPYMQRYRERGNVKFPFFLTPERHYVGKAWYRRTVRVPKNWKGEQIVLFMERPHIETRVFVNGREAGHQMSLSVPHQYDITDLIRPGRKNEIVVCVYNGIENVGVGQDSHSVTDQTQGNWNGVVGRLELSSRPQPVIRITHDAGRRVACIQVDSCRYEVALGDTVRLWSEFDPYLYTRTVIHQGRPLTVTFGLRDIAIRERQLLLNGKPIWLRGTVENCCFPETGYPPTDEASWMRIFKKLKDNGLNHVRFHSYCPPEAAFAAADKLGLYLQQEGPSWPNHGVRLGRGQVIDQYLIEESKRIIDSYGHHPSFVMMAAGNEPAGDWVTYCNNWVRLMKEYDPSKIYCGASVGGGWAWDDGSEYHVKGGARGLDWNTRPPHSDDDYYSQIEFPRNYRESQPNRSPVIAHEQGQWCAFPDLKEMGQYTGAYKARNFEIFRDLLTDHGMATQAERFLMASGKLQTLAYKYEIERNLRTPDYSGFQLLGLNDYSGQGTALVGVLNVHWQEKGYATSADWTQFCAPVVPLALFPRFVYANTDTLVVPVQVYNASDGPLLSAQTIYSIKDGAGSVVAAGVLSDAHLPVGKNNAVGVVRFPLNSILEPSKLTLCVQIGSDICNSWEFWVYPQDFIETSAVPAGIYVADSLDTQAKEMLKRGGKVLLTAAGKIRLGNDVVQHYLPVFWNTSWFKMRPPHTTGAYIDAAHPLFKYGFPTDDWSNLNWWELLNRAQVMNLMDFPADYQSPIQPIDTWHVSRKLGMLIEANVLGGKLLMTTMDITSDLEHRLVAHQMRRAILRYMASNDFCPKMTLQPQIISNLYSKEGPKVEMHTNESPDELKPKVK
ncbi:MAG: beta-glucuronidase [Bacteroidaceae bacterium]|nr:beta-glucuronidase [Bacteroidaceae bacterium]